MERVEFSGDDENNIKRIKLDKVEIFPSLKSSIKYKETTASSKVSVKPVVKYFWEYQYYATRLVTRHQYSSLIAYTIQHAVKKATTNELKCGMVRLLNTETGQKLLLRCFEDDVTSLEFAFSEDVLLAVLDKSATLRVFKVHQSSEPTDPLSYDIAFIIQPPSVFVQADIQVVKWCPYNSGDYLNVLDRHLNSSKVSESFKNPSLLFAFTIHNKVFGMDLKAVTDLLHSKYSQSSGFVTEYGDSTTTHNNHQSNSWFQEQIKEAVTEYKSNCLCYFEMCDHSDAVSSISISCDACYLASSSLDGQVCVYSLKDHDVQAKSYVIKPIYIFSPHDGSPVYGLEFFDYTFGNNQRQVWSHFVTGSQFNRELKVWSCFDWSISQTLQFRSSTCVSAMDSSAEASTIRPGIVLTSECSSSLLLASDITRKVLYIFEFGQLMPSQTNNESNKQVSSAKMGFISVGEYLLVNPCLLFALGSCTRTTKSTLADEISLEVHVISPRYLLNGTIQFTLPHWSELDTNLESNSHKFVCPPILSASPQESSVVSHTPINLNDTSETVVTSSMELSELTKVTDQPDSSLATPFVSQDMGEQLHSEIIECKTMKDIVIYPKTDLVVWKEKVTFPEFNKEPLESQQSNITPELIKSDNFDPNSSTCINVDEENEIGHSINLHIEPPEAENLPEFSQTKFFEDDLNEISASSPISVDHRLVQTSDKNVAQSHQKEDETNQQISANSPIYQEKQDLSWPTEVEMFENYIPSSIGENIQCVELLMGKFSSFSGNVSFNSSTEHNQFEKSGESHHSLADRNQNPESHIDDGQNYSTLVADGGISSDNNNHDDCTGKAVSHVDMDVGENVHSSQQDPDELDVEMKIKSNGNMMKTVVNLLSALTNLSKSQTEQINSLSEQLNKTTSKLEKLEMIQLGIIEQLNIFGQQTFTQTVVPHSSLPNCEDRIASEWGNEVKMQLRTIHGDFARRLLQLEQILNKLVNNFDDPKRTNQQMKVPNISNLENKVNLLPKLTSDLIRPIVRNELHNSFNSNTKILLDSLEKALGKMIPSMLSENLSRILRDKNFSVLLAQLIATSLSSDLISAYRDSLHNLFVPNLENAIQRLFTEINILFQTGTQQYLQQISSFTSTQKLDGEIVNQLTSKIKNLVSSTVIDVIGQLQLPHLSTTPRSSSTHPKQPILESSIFQSNIPSTGLSVTNSCEKLSNTNKFNKSNSNLNTSTNTRKENINSNNSNQLTVTSAAIITTSTAIATSTTTSTTTTTNNNNGDKLVTGKTSISKINKNKKKSKTVNEINANKLDSPSSPNNSTKSENVTRLVGQAQILIHSNKFIEALELVLTSTNQLLLLDVCNDIDPNKVFISGDTHLKQNVLLSLIHQLSCGDLNFELDLKLKYLQGALLCLDRSDPTTITHGPGILKLLSSRLDGLLNSPTSVIKGTSETSSNLRARVVQLNCIIKLLSGQNQMKLTTD